METLQLICDLLSYNYINQLVRSQCKTCFAGSEHMSVIDYVEISSTQPPEGDYPLSEVVLFNRPIIAV